MKTKISPRRLRVVIPNSPLPSRKATGGADSAASSEARKAEEELRAKEKFRRDFAAARAGRKY